MNSQHDQNLSAFETLISSWEAAYCYAVISYVGLKMPQGRRLLFGRIVLESSRAGLIEEDFKFETEHLVAARFVCGVAPACINSFLAKARNGEIQAIDGSPGLALQMDGALSSFFSPIHHPFISEGPRLPTLRVNGISRHNLVVSVVDPRVLDWELKAAEAPFDNLDELLSYCGLPTQVHIGDSTALEIVAKAPAMIVGTSTINEGNVVVDCHLASGLDTAQLRLGYKVFKKDAVTRESVAGSGFAWQQEGDIKLGRYEMSIGDVSLLQGFLSYAGVCHHQWWISDPQKRLNPRHAIHQIFDEDMELLKRMLLKPETDKPYIFEGAVSNLFNLLGFSVSNYGRIPKLQKGPDIIAFSPNGHVAVIECTVGLIDENDKLAKLVQRTKLIRDKLNETGYELLQLQPVIVTPLSRDEIAAHLEIAEKYDIAVVCGDDIEQLLNQVSLPSNANKLFEDAKRLIPTVGQGSLFGYNT